MFINVGSERLVLDWAEEQSFPVYYYRGWQRSFFFEETNHFILLKLQVPQEEYLLNRPSNPKFLDFYTAWHTEWNKVQEEFKAKIRLERIARGEKVD